MSVAALAIDQLLHIDNSVVEQLYRNQGGRVSVRMMTNLTFLLTQLIEEEILF